MVHQEFEVMDVSIFKFWKTLFYVMMLQLIELLVEVDNCFNALPEDVQ